MQSKIVLATTLLAAVASAENFMIHPQMRRDLEARATATSDALDCANAILSVYSDVPTPPADIMSDLLDNPQTDPCHFTIAKSLSKEYSSYSKEVMSWYDDHSKAIESALSKCPSESSYAVAVPTCDSNAGNNKATATVGSDSAETTKGSNSAANTGSASTGSATSGSAAHQTSTTGAASHQTAMAAAAMAAAGLAVALL